MGATQSSNTQPQLEELSVDDICAYVGGLGAKYKGYCAAIEENAVDGEVLASLLELDDEEEGFKETLECLDITNFLHQRVLLKHWKKAKESVVKTTASPPSSPPPPTKTVSKTSKLKRTETGTVATDASEITLDTALSTQLQSTAAASQESGSVVEEDSESVTVHDDTLPLIISVEQIQAVGDLELPRSVDVLPPGSQELEPFQQMALQMLKEFHAGIAEVNLLDVDNLHVDKTTGTHTSARKGVNNLTFCTAVPSAAAPTGLTRFHQDDPSDWEACRSFILASSEEYREMDVPPAVIQATGMTEPATYYGHIVTNGAGVRIGTVCVCVQQNKVKLTTEEQKREILKFMASEAERQFEQRKVLLQRSHNLRDDIEHMKRNMTEQEHQDFLEIQDPVLAPAYGPIKSVVSSRVDSRQTLFPYPREDNKLVDNGSPTSPQFNRRSAGLPAFSPDQQANHFEERLHLGPNFYEPKEHPFPIADEAPVGKHDMERVAFLNSLEILELDPTSEESNAIQSLLSMAGTLLEADLVYVTFLDHRHLNLMFPVYMNKDLRATHKMRAFMDRFHTLVKRNPMDGTPFLLRSDRCRGICNYSVMTPGHQTFVVHDVARDESLHPYKALADIGFYSGTPIVIQGMAVGTLCCLSRNPRPDFGRVQEVQQEEFAKLIARQYETWSLQRHMNKLELERRNLALVANRKEMDASSKSLAAPKRVKAPEDYAALVNTSVEGAAAMAQADPEAMRKAEDLHNRIVRSKMSEHSGYEVSSEGSDFQVAFSDVADAVLFCLQAQEALHAASWEQDILALMEGCNDPSSGFRGLRVSMAIHCGDVESTKDRRNGRVTYKGETHHMCKNLSTMGHGGQILVTVDVWNVASHLVETTLGSPQVVDLGAHVMQTKSNHMYDGITTRNILQLVPASLSHDYFQSRQRGVESTAAAQGRVFPPLRTKKAVGSSFHDAPCGNDNTVALLVIDTSEVENMVGADASVLLTGLSKYIATTLGAHGEGRGYQCSDFVVAFGEVSDAVRFGLALQESLEKQDVLDHCLAGKLKIGVQEGVFATMGPNRITGRAEYFGRVVHQVGLVAQASEPGCVYLGKEPDELDGFNLQPISNGFMLDFMGRAWVPDTRMEFSLYKCHPCTSWYDQVLKNRSPWMCNRQYR